MHATSDPYPPRDDGDDPEAVGEKRFRSVKEYREKKKLQRTFSGASTGQEQGFNPAYVPNPSNSTSSKDDFVKLVKDTVARLCFDHLGNSEADRSPTSSDHVPEWRVVSRLVSQTLIDKEARMPTEVRFNLSDAKARDGAIRRVSGYTSDYLKRKFP